MPSSPLIGITIGSLKHPKTSELFAGVRRTYIHAVEVAGGAPLLIPYPLEAATLRSIYERLDGLIISGGGDVNPDRYGAACSPLTDNIDGDRDETELHLARWAVEDDKPLLCICRGTQILNIALGGTLIQDIGTQVPGSIKHDFEPPTGFGHIAHQADIVAGSRLQEALGKGTTRVSVNSLHHQALDRIGEGLTVAACAPDGIIEGVEREDARFTIGVQWHPEAMVDEHETMKHLFESLVNAART